MVGPSLSRFLSGRIFLRAATKWKREDYCELVKPFFLFFFFFFFVLFYVFFFPCRMSKKGSEEGEGWKRSWPLARFANQGPEGEELMKERDLRIPCKWRAWIIHSNKIMQPTRTSDRAKTALNRRSRTPRSTPNSHQFPPKLSTSSSFSHKCRLVLLETWDFSKLFTVIVVSLKFLGTL